MEDLLEQIREFNRQRDWEQYHSPKNLVIALMVEVAELAEKFQWMTEKESRKLPLEKIKKVEGELGDVFIYLLNLSDKLGVDLLEAAQKKLKINDSKYPAEKVKGKSLKYKEY